MWEHPLNWRAWKSFCRYYRYQNPKFTPKEGLETLKNCCKNEGEHISLILVKDLDNSRKNGLHPNLGNDYKEFSIQPKMILHLREDWTTFEDYLAAMTSKYRVRAKRAFKKGTFVVV